jgi:hypothetical protein
MFRKKKKRAWYWQVLGMLAALRVIYAFARFFLKMAEKQGNSAADKQLKQHWDKVDRRLKRT